MLSKDAAMSIFEEMSIIKGKLGVNCSKVHFKVVWKEDSISQNKILVHIIASLKGDVIKYKEIPGLSLKVSSSCCQ